MRTGAVKRLALPLLGLLAGCTMPQYGTYTHQVDVAGGETVNIAFAGGRPVPAENDDFRVGVAGLKLVGRDVYLVFSLYSKNGTLPRRVTVEDVAGTSPEQFVDDRNPKFIIDPRKPGASSRTWAWQMGPLVRTQWRPPWFHDPDVSVRVYRFTVVTGDGRQVVLDQGTNYPAQVKEFILKSLPEAPPKNPDSAEVVPMTAE
jgi:hypothetical protein